MTCCSALCNIFQCACSASIMYDSYSTPTLRQIFSFVRDWSKHVTWLNKPQKNIWRIIKTIVSIWLLKYAGIFVFGHYNFLGTHRGCGWPQTPLTNRTSGARAVFRWQSVNILALGLADVEFLYSNSYKQVLKIIHQTESCFFFPYGARSRLINRLYLKRIKHLTVVLRPWLLCGPHPSCRALIRPGRFDTKIHVPMPDVKGRHDILKLHLKNVQVSDGKIIAPSRL